MTLKELLHSIHSLENYLQKFESAYGLRSADFYRLATTGTLEQQPDFIEWLGVYEIKLKREREYQQGSSSGTAMRFTGEVKKLPGTTPGPIRMTLRLPVPTHTISTYRLISNVTASLRPI